MGEKERAQEREHERARDKKEKKRRESVLSFLEID